MPWQQLLHEAGHSAEPPMSLQRISAVELLASFGQWDTLIDARSESEYALDHLPGAINWPTLDDLQRAQVGAAHKQDSAFEARKQGAALAAANIAHHLQQHLKDKSRQWRPVVYCWRGGQRSGSLSWVLSEIGFAVRVLEGGYRAFRRAVVDALEVLPGSLRFQVLCGRTGSAKSRLLQALALQGAQVLDLEQLACHRGSVLGAEPGQPQPGQKAFETQLWHALSRMDPARVIYTESESRTIGRMRLPEALLSRLRASPCIHVELDLQQRVAFLLRDYAHLVADTEHFCGRLEALRELRGAAKVAHWQALARQAQPDNSAPLEQVVQELLTEHYDPVYLRSMQRNYSRFDDARPLRLPDGEPGTLEQQARALIQAHATSDHPDHEH